MSDKEDVVNPRPPSSATFAAVFRQGAKEIGQIIPAFPDSIRPVEEMGTMLNPTPQQVTRALDGQPGPIQPKDQGFEAMFNTYAPRGGEGRETQQKEIER